jgi:hypothetical protein
MRFYDRDFSKKNIVVVGAVEHSRPQELAPRTAVRKRPKAAILPKLKNLRTAVAASNDRSCQARRALRAGDWTGLLTLYPDFLEPSRHRLAAQNA